jgi:hypothetical protein
MERVYRYQWLSDIYNKEDKMKNTTKNYLLIGSVVLLFTAAGLLYGARSGEAQNNEQTVTTKKGKTIHIKAEGKVFTTDAANGTYKLTNGGAIRVKGGKVVWDAFGAVNRLKKGQWKGYIDTNG